MQYQLSLNHASPPSVNPALVESSPALRAVESFSEIVLHGGTDRCRQLLLPLLKGIGEACEDRWLTLVAPPAWLSSVWLRKAGVKCEGLLVLQPRGAQSAAELAREALQLGRSHTVITWMDELDDPTRQALDLAALTGQGQCLNVRFAH